MRNVFPGFYQLDKKQIDKLWKNCVFVFDTNVLLDLYRYQSATRDELLKVLEDLSDRVFLPHHVALEYQTNRLSVIAEQYSKFDKVSGVVSKNLGRLRSEIKEHNLTKRHSDIEVEGFLTELKNIENDFVKNLNKVKNRSLAPKDSDKIRKRIEKVFEGSLGAHFDNSELEEIYTEGEIRYSRKIPPGYNDAEKTQEYMHRGSLIKQKYGDLILWKQILVHAFEKKLKDIIFITSDSKSDWMWIEKKGGTWTYKCRQELTDEILSKSGVERFHIYRTEQFLEFSKKHLGANVTDSVITDVQNTSKIRSEKLSSRNTSLKFYYKAEIAVERWLASSLEVLATGLTQNEPDFIALNSKGKIAIEAISVKENEGKSIYKTRVNSALERVQRWRSHEYSQVYLVIVCENSNIANDIHNHLVYGNARKNVDMLVVGKLIFDGELSDAPVFKPLHRYI